MNIVSIDCGLAPALRDLGHTVRELYPDAGVICLEPLVEDFCPDLILQQERLGPRVLVADLPRFACSKVFWSIDTHLNAFWHVFYGRLFDLTLTTQKPWVATLARELPSVAWLPWHGLHRPLRPWEERTTPILFVGRVGPTRPLRTWFVDTLRQFPGFRLETDLSLEVMLQTYDQACIAPNEAILGEINFRLFEAASCGCAVITPKVPGLGDLFIPGEEILAYDHGAECLEMVRHLIAHPAKARLLGARAYARIHAEHLPAHRARTLMDILPHRQTAACGETARAMLWCTIAVLREASRLEMSAQSLEQHLIPLAHFPEIEAALLRLEMETAPHAATARLRHLAAHPPANPALLAQAGVAALRLGLGDEAAALQEAAHLPPTDSPAARLLDWASWWERHGVPCRPGFLFDPGRHLPASALETLILAHEIAPEDERPLQRMSALLAPWRGYEATRLGALAFLGLRHPDDWRLGLDLALTNARAFRLKEAAEELLLALEAANTAGEEEKARQKLAESDPRGGLLRLLCRQHPVFSTFPLP